MKEAIQLLQYWQAYSEKAVEPSLIGFSSWLSDELHPQKEAQESVVPAPYAPSANMSVGFLLGNLMAYAEIWTKVAFRNLPIQHFHDFGSLSFIERQGNPTKKEIAEDSLQEQSSCFEALKRMTKNGLLEDFEDSYDKRVRRVQLTDKGREVLGQAMHQAGQLSDLLVGDLNLEQKESLIKSLTRLVKFHEGFYQSGGKDRAISQYDL